MALRCVRDYMLLGWSGYVPGACRRSITGSYHDTGGIQTDRIEVFAKWMQAARRQ
jgi:hypothetical protein